MQITSIKVTCRRSFPMGATPNCGTVECSLEATLDEGEDVVAARQLLFAEAREGVREGIQAITQKDK